MSEFESQENDFNSSNRDNSFKTTSTRVVNTNQNETCTQLRYTRLKAPDDLPLDPENPKVTKIVKVYQKKTIRQIGPDGEISEEVFESGDRIPDILQSSEINIPNIKNDSNLKLCGESKMQTTLGFRMVSELGEENSSTISSGPVVLSVQVDAKNNLPAGATITKTFQHGKSQTVTHSETVDGDEKVIFSKTQFMSVCGASKHEVKPTDQNIEDDIHIEMDAEQSNNKTSEPNVEILDTVVPSKPTENLKESPVDDTKLPYDVNHSKKLIKLTKILKFNDSSPNIDILSKTILKEGTVKAMEAFQFSANMLKKISSKPKKKFHLIVFSDHVLIAYKKTSTEAVVIEFCDKNDVNAYNYFETGTHNMNFGKQKGKGNLLCVPPNNLAKKLVTEQFFVLQIKKESAAVLTGPVVLAAVNIENRDQWIKVISRNSP